ncbi:hypothetical protein JAAARDRAFT_59177 [Jaapia argillacea MUCL 33604]|uniref:Saccharopine dehydrogenase NADP binding domain-containing protein n=1 Tax=Jaapia argillacea MUCL 33604 TaxID=933084 RepID=A0A067PR36_9AGAM|nr:hypothetical protein JAAARDRAFT_59177 [Jaapia argillacea MUCL 33604]
MALQNDKPAPAFDVLLFGATGFTGRLITRYLSAHPQRSTFKFAIAARSKSKLDALVNELGLDKNTSILVVDVTKKDQVEEAVKQTKVVINTVGPYWRWGTPVVRACAVHGRHYVDLTGETPWIMSIIFKYDYLAFKTGAMIIPSCGMDSIPSDISVYLSNKTLKAAAGPDACIDESTTAFKIKGGISGGTIASMFTMLEEVPPHIVKAARQDFAISTSVTGRLSKPPRLVYTLPQVTPPIIGSFFIMSHSNKAIVQRSWGLFQMDAFKAEAKATAAEKDSKKLLTYGPEFRYEEFLAMPSTIGAAAFSLVMGLIAVTLMIPPLRYLAKRYLPKSGYGPSDQEMEKGFLKATNITSSIPTSTAPRTHVKTVIKGRGDPGYLLTSMMISECALALALEQDALPRREGGVLTPVTALGDVLVKRLKDTGRFEFESEVLKSGEADTRKTR